MSFFLVLTKVTLVCFKFFKNIHDVLILFLDDAKV